MKKLKISLMMLMALGLGTVQAYEEMEVFHEPLLPKRPEENNQNEANEQREQQRLREEQQQRINASNHDSAQRDMIDEQGIQLQHPQPKEQFESGPDGDQIDTFEETALAREKARKQSVRDFADNLKNNNKDPRNFKKGGFGDVTTQKVNKAITSIVLDVKGEDSYLSESIHGTTLLIENPAERQKITTLVNKAKNLRDDINKKLDNDKKDFLHRRSVGDQKVIGDKVEELQAIAKEIEDIVAGLRTRKGIEEQVKNYLDQKSHTTSKKLEEFMGDYETVFSKKQKASLDKLLKRIKENESIENDLKERQKEKEAAWEEESNNKIRKQYEKAQNEGRNPLAEQ